MVAGLECGADFQLLPPPAQVEEKGLRQIP
jgi:hypothetical protein